jgi:PTH1 family peptidyl-tRNA hydrolase
MNRSGYAVKACADHYGVDTSHILVVHDDLDLGVGRVKGVRHGGSGGHRGVQSIIDSLGVTQFPRIKVGIGRPRYGETIESYVLSPFYDDQIKIMGDITHLAILGCEIFVSEGIESVMNHINSQNFANHENKEVLS